MTVFSQRRRLDSGERGDDLDGGLDAADEGRDEDTVNGEAEIGPELGAGAEGADAALLDERWIPGTRGVFDPAGLKVVDTVAVAHDDDVLVAVGGGVVGFGADELGHWGEEM